jgi:ABC-type transport system involved in multi-copper enzyme maturation permease subunit
MPIYDQGYRRYVARAPLHSARFWPITREALRLVLAKRAFLGLLAASFIPFIVRVIQIYLVTRVPEAGRVLPIDGRLFGDFLNQQIGFTLLLSVFGASGLVANDLRTGAILVYLSRPLTQRDYVLGKLGVPMALNLAVTLVPGLLLYAAGLMLAPEQYAKVDLWWIPPAIVAHAAAISLVVSLLTLAVSALSKSGRVAGLAFVAVFFGLEMIRGVLQAGFNRREAALLSLQADLKAVGTALFDTVDPASTVHWAWPILVLVVVAVGCLAVLRARVRAVEIVS